jgi:hypothetical protein
MMCIRRKENTRLKDKSNPEHKKTYTVGEIN